MRPGDSAGIERANHSCIATVGQHFQLAFVTMYEVATTANIDIILAQPRNHVVDATTKHNSIIAVAGAWGYGLDQS